MLPEQTFARARAADGARGPLAPDAAAPRTVFLSDFHLGTLGCDAVSLLEFLRRHDPATLYLVGDIFDNWRPIGSNWNESHEQVLKLLLGRARAGRRIVYIPGNHDDFFRRYLGRYFDELEIRVEAWHVTASGDRLLVTHGDCCDIFAHRFPWLSRAGSWLEAGARRIGQLIGNGFARAGRDRWDGIELLIDRINARIRAHDRFEERLSMLARRRGADGIVCGHFHQPALHRDHGVIYANCGDWISNCSALIEHSDGTLDLVRWKEAAPGFETRGAEENELGMAT